MKRVSLILTLLGLLLLAVACQQEPDEAVTETPASAATEVVPTEDTTPTEEPEPTALPEEPEPTAETDEQVEPYPPPRVPPTPEVYPPPTEEVRQPDAYPYPPPGRVVDESKRFTFDEPVAAGTTEVTGTGYPDTPMVIISISNGGVELGTTTVNADGTYNVELSRAVEEREVLGIKLGPSVSMSGFMDAPGTDIPTLGFILAQTVAE
jgi:outer membrane biosynthesis protein TonB